MKKLYDFKPDYVVHPGLFLEDVLEGLNISTEQFSKMVDMPIEYIQSVLDSKEILTADTSKKFGDALGISGSIFYNMSTNFHRHNKVM